MSSVQDSHWERTVAEDDDYDMLSSLLRTVSDLLGEDASVLQARHAALMNADKWIHLQEDLLEAELARPGRRGQDQRRYTPLHERCHPHESFWWKMLQRGESGEAEGKGCRVPDSREGRWFRLRFRVPYAHFRSIVNGLRALDDDMKWWSERCDVTGTPAYPLELKVLSVLRILGRAWCFDDISGNRYYVLYLHG